MALLASVLLEILGSQQDYCFRDPCIEYIEQVLARALVKQKDATPDRFIQEDSQQPLWKTA